MRTTLRFLHLGGLIGITWASWYYFDQLLIIFASILVNIVSRFTFEAVALVIVTFLKRYLFIELPKRLLIFLAYCRMSTRSRRKVRRNLLRIRDFWERWFSWLWNEHVALLCAVGISVAMFAIGYLYFDVWIVLLVGTSSIIRALRFLLLITRDYTRLSVHRIAVFFGIDILRVRVLGLLPETVQLYLGTWRNKFLRKALKKKSVDENGAADTRIPVLSPERINL
jgi:hypothetical protein